MKKLGWAIPVLAIALSGTTACATKKFVRTERRRGQRRRSTLSPKSVEETQERTRANEGRIGEVDQTRRRPASAARPPTSRPMTPVQQPMRSALAPTRSSARPEAARLRSRPERRQGQLQVRQGGHAGRSEGRNRSARGAAEGRAEGRVHRDRGPHGCGRPDHLNYQLGLERAENVKRYLYETAPGAASQDQRDQLRRREADRAEQDQGRPRAEPPRRHQGAHLESIASTRSLTKSACPRPGASSSRRRLRWRGFRPSHSEVRRTGSGTHGRLPGWSGMARNEQRQHFRRVLRVPLPVGRTLDFSRGSPTSAPRAFSITRIAANSLPTCATP